MTQTSTLCSHRSISHSCEELWSMPCIISWAPALRARPPQDVRQSLLTVALRRLTEPSTRKIAAQEPPSSSGHNDAPPADLAHVSTGPDSAEGAYPPHLFRPLWTHTRRLCRRRWAARLGAHRLFMVFVTKRPEASSRMTRAAERCDIPLDVDHMAHRLTKLS